jgi:hypothetical protein
MEALGMFYRALISVMVISMSVSLIAQKTVWQPAPGHKELPIWPKGAPGATDANPPAEVDTTTPKDNLIAGKPLVRLGNVSTPTITL